MNYSEIHLHLEGSVFSDALKKITKRRNIKQYNFSKLPLRESFFERMNYISKEILVCKQDYLDVFESLCNFLAPTHNYVELTISPGAYDYYNNGDFEEILSELSQKAIQQPYLKINFLIDLLRNSGIDNCWTYLDFAKKSFDNLSNVVGISLGGDEVKYPTKDYIPHIIKAKEYGLMTTIHAGEFGSVDDIWMALEGGADRIGHGIRAVDDKSLLDKLSKDNTLLEICPTSNLHTGASQDLGELAVLAKKGINLTINTDDPSIFNTTLEHELNIFKTITKNYQFKLPLFFNKKKRRKQVSCR